MPNGINDISPSLRDNLLNRNLILSDTILNSGLVGLAVGLGYPAQIETPPSAVQASESIEDNGQFYRDLNLINNPYKSQDDLEQIDINTYSVVNIGNLPPGSSPVEYQQNVGSENENSTFNTSADEARSQMLKNKYFDASLVYKVNLNTISVSTSHGGAYDYKANVLSRNIEALANAVNLGGVAQQTPNVTDNTPLSQIGATQLVNHFGYNAAFGAAQNSLGHINLNPLSLLQGNDILIPSYQITIPKGQEQSAVDFGAKVLGFETPVSQLDQSSSIFASESPGTTNIARANSMVVNTGKGQVLALIDNLNQNKYRPTITDDRQRENITKGETGTNGGLYVFEGNEVGTVRNLLDATPDFIPTEGPTTIFDAQLPTPESEFELNHGKITSELDGGFNSEFDDLTNRDFGFFDSEVRDFGEAATTKFTWTDDKNKKGEELGVYSRSDMTNKKSLLYKTQSLFNTNRTRNLITAKGDILNMSNEVTTGVLVGSTQFISKGSGVKSQAALEGTATEPEDVFCRVWTTFDRYNQVQDLQKNDGINGQVGLRVGSRTELSILDETTSGFARISPYASEPDVKRFMLSLENLAWNDHYSLLPPCEKGVGDPVTNTKGRIMWFPPYEITFTDTTSVNWDTTNFIGRGEPVYTYNNTERTGTLGFKIIIDYATYMNDLRSLNVDNDLYASIAAGCVDFDREVIKQLSQPEKDRIDVENNDRPDTIEAQDSGPVPPKFVVYFPNDVVRVPSTSEPYEDGDGEGLGKIRRDDGYNSIITVYYDDRTDFGLNTTGQTLTIPGGATYQGWLGNTYLEDLATYIVEECPSCRINIDGYASKDGRIGPNQRLSQDRANNIQTLITEYLVAANDPLSGKRFGRKPKGNGEIGPEKFKVVDGKEVYPVDSLDKKKSRTSTISFEKDPALEQQIIDAQKIKEQRELEQELSREIRARFFDECSYFEKIAEDSPFLFERMSEKIAFFHPAFHSTTPEGFNARLNFLHQCTRQGPTTNDNGDPSNLAFGMPPVCILRIGDFYHTKIVIDTMDLSFEPLVWDLNPEGVGVQPMIANVSLSFKFIGGSSMQGPLNKLQNAVSFNFFANTGIYDSRADYIDNGVLKNGFTPNDEDRLRQLVNPSEETGIAGGNDRTVNQTTEAEKNVVNNNEADAAQVTQGDPKITGLKILDSAPFGSANTYLLRVNITTENIYDNSGALLITEEELNTFVDKGVNLKVMGDNGQTVIIDDIVKITGDEFKTWEDAAKISKGYYLGTNTSSAKPLIELEEGKSYTVSLTYNGNKVANRNINT